MSAMADTMDAELDLMEAAPPLIGRIAGGMLGISGLMMIGSATQMLLFFHLRTPQLVVVVLLLLLGLLTAVTAPFLVKGRVWASLLGSGLCGTLALAGTGWWIYTLVNVVFSPLLMVTVGLFWLTLPVLPFTIGPTFRASKARRALYR